jgi:hypothetical protein
MSIVLGFAIFALLLVIVLLIQRIQQENDLLRSMLEALQESKTREWETNQQVEKVFMSLSPVLSQTDWMTGRWGGQFEALVSMEKARNEEVKAIRSTLMALPFLDEYVKANSSSIFTPLPADKMPLEDK